MEEGNIAFGIIIGLLFVGILILFCILMIKLYIRKIQGYTRVIYEKDLAFQRALTETIMETQEHVLNDISQELHDDAGQQITYINFLIENLKLDAVNTTLPLEELSQAVSNLSGSVRRISHSLSGQQLIQQNIVHAIEAETIRLNQLNSLTVSFYTDNFDTKNLGSNKQIVIFRIFQETINNILKHSGATAIRISIQTHPRFSLIVTDNGKGFDYLTVKQTAKGMGLRNLESRADLVGFNVAIHSAEGDGTTINLTEK